MRSTFNYWRSFSRTGGPTSGALIFPDGILEFSFLDDTWHDAQKRLGQQIGEIWKVPHDGTFNADGSLRIGNRDHTLRSAHHKTIAEAEAKFRADYQELLEYQHKIETDPVFNLEEQLGCHDWYYQMSDDHSVWSGGQRHWDQINKLIHQVPVEKVHELWAKYAPDDCKCPV